MEVRMKIDGKWRKVQIYIFHGLKQIKGGFFE